MMGLFDRLFRRRLVKLEPDSVWPTDEGRFRGLWSEAAARRHETAVLVMAHFSETLAAARAAGTAAGVPFDELTSQSHVAGHLASRIEGSVGLGLTRDLPDAAGLPPGRPGRLLLLVAERHPLRRRDEQALGAVARLEGSVEVRFHVSLEDALLKRFVGERLAPLLEQLGLEPSEAVRSKMVDGAIARAQRQVERQARSDVEASSAAAWLQVNV